MTSWRVRLRSAHLAQLLGLLWLSYLVMASYGLARPASESLFLETYSARALPWVWLGVAAGTTVIVGIYNRFALAMDLITLFASSTLITVLLLVLLLVAWGQGFVPAAFLLYVWKDIYVIVLIEIFWSFANAIFPIRTARWIYGLVLVIGSLGAISANMAALPIAEHFGTIATLWAVAPMLVLVLVGCIALAPSARAAAPATERVRTSSVVDGIRVLTKSRYLVLLLVLIAVVQVVITIVDFQFNEMVETAFPDMDERTGVIGQIYAAINSGSMLLQLLTGPLLRAAGVPLTLLAIPVLLGMSLVAFAAFPQFLTMAIAKVTSKVFDYSVFRAAKEILYIPLSYKEKTQGKALIDIMAYRVAKGAASLLLLLLAALGLTHLTVALALVLIAWWWWLTHGIARRYREIVSRDEELASHRHDAP